MKMTRSAFLKSAAAGLMLAPSLLGMPAFAAGPMQRKPIPNSKNGETLPVIGVGTNRFGRFEKPEEAARRGEVLRALFEGGGSVVDTAEAYPGSEVVIGDFLDANKLREKAFIVSKVMKDGRDLGIETMNGSFARLKTKVIDGMLVHNLRDTQTHLPVLREWKQEGRFRYIGASHSTPDQQEALFDVIAKEKIDLVQLNYSVDTRGPEQRLLPAARDNGVAVMVNLPLGRGRLLEKMKDKPVPEWAQKELNCTSYAQLLLKWVISHPAVTVAIPGTTTPRYMAENAAAGAGPLATPAQRDKIAALWA
jgi:aryl-alcohol dehydrogenase-like predicted oxidoreductase